MTTARAEGRILTGLFLAHALGSAASIAMATIAAIVGAELGGRTWLAGFPGAAFHMGGAITALLVAWFVTRLGRRGGLTAAALLGFAGMAVAMVAVIQGAFTILLVALVLAGTGSAAVRFARFTAAEIVPHVRRGRAVAVVVTGGTVGSVLGPALVAPTGAWSAAQGWGNLAGPFVAATILMLTAAAVFHAFLRPEPRTLAAMHERPESVDGTLSAPRPWGTLLRDPGVMTAIVVLVLAQGVMVMLMGITSLHMHAHDHTMSLISLVFSGHTLGMYAFSLASGYAADRFGRTPVMLVGGWILAVSCLVAPLSPAVVPIFLALFLLGYGWNLAYVAGSAMLSDHLSTREKSATQGVTDLAMGMTSAMATLIGGAVFAVAGFAVMSFAGLVGSLALIIITVRYRRTVTRAGAVPAT